MSDQSRPTMTLEPGIQEAPPSTIMNEPTNCDELDSESDNESFTDALEQLDLQTENPVIFDRSNEILTTIVPKESVVHTATGNQPSDHANMVSPEPAKKYSDPVSDDPTADASPTQCGAELTDTEDQTIENMIKTATVGDTNSNEDEDLSGSETEAEVIDEEELRQKEALMSEEEKQEKKEESNSIKLEGNERFKTSNFQAAIESYTEALMTCPLCFPKERAIMYSNRAACKLKLERYDTAIEDCTKALELHPVYLKALLRRAELYEKTDKLEDALSDYQKALELDPTLLQARQAITVLPKKIEERNEKMKEEMLGKLKDLGNMILRPFGLSTQNFNLQKDPSSGSYSVQFQQGPPQPPDNGV